MNVGKNSVWAGILLTLLACKTPQPAQTPVAAAPVLNDTIPPSMHTTVADNSRTDAFLENLLAAHPEYFGEIMKRKEDFRVQVIYTKIDRHKNGRVSFTDYYYHVNPDQYFYPASTVKFPIAVLALQKLRELEVPGLDKNTTMITEPLNERLTGVFNDPSAADGRPSIAHYIKKIFLVSDNDAFNRLYEFLGQDYIHTRLHAMGYTQTDILHRLSISLSAAENKRGNPVRFFNSAGEMVYEKPESVSSYTPPARTVRLGTGFMRGNQRIDEPFDFSTRNRLVLQDLHAMLKALYFPAAVPAHQRFNLLPEDYTFLYRYMSMLPGESDFPSYDTATAWPAYVKFLYYGSEKGALPPQIRIFNKVGDAYGFLTDVAYFTDVENGIEFMLSATIHCNSDGIFNDDQYEYDSIGFPFMKHLGRVIYDYERKRERKVKPDLSTLQFSYKQ